ncbi:MAG TPA: carboxypeptidase regulatory-like domain-containing protein [Bryobacteraceae bacterium]
MRTLSVAFCLALLSASLFGQAGTGTITGTVTDPAGAVVANAPVEVRNTDTNVLYPTVTTATGNYTVLRLPPGPYSISVSAAGFKKLTRAGLSVDAGQTLPQDLALEVGSASESVTVSAEGTLLKTESSDVSHNITLGQLDELPILGIGTQNAGSNGIRNPYNSVVFLPGVSYFANFAMIVNGAPSNSAGYRVEGLDNTNHTVAFAIMQNMPNADAIQEMAVQTSNYAAEYGQAGGGLFNITMKSGTNQYHGTVFEYFVNEDLNAGVPFSFTPEGGKYRPRNRRNDYGGTFGGPFIIPKVYNGKNRTFFFYSYERYKEAQGLTFPDTLPALPYQAGNFAAISPNGGTGFNSGLGITATSVATDALGRPVYANSIYDPLTRSTTSSGVGIANPFPNNIIPTNRFSPVAVAIQGLYPKLTNGNLYQNYTGNNLGQRITAIPSIKVDQTIGTKGKLAFYFHHTDTQAQFTTPNGNADGLPDLLTGARGSIPIGGPTYRLNYDYTVTPTLLAHVGAGYSMIYFYDDGPYTRSGQVVNCQSMLQLQGCEGAFNFPTVITGVTTSPAVLGGMQQLGNALAHTHTHTERPSANANMTWVRGNHTYKAGAEVWWQAQITAPPTGVGMTFGAGATSIPASLVISGGNTVGFPYASFLLGDATSTTQYAPVDARMFKSQWAMFLQDSWKITRKLTFDYGLRWDYGSVPHEEYGRSADLSLTIPNANAGGRLGAAQFESTCNCSFIKGYPYAVAPRLGFAYQLNAKTVLRGGWGFAFAPPGDLNIQNTAQLTNTPTGVNNFVALNTPNAIPQPTWPNFNPSQTPLPGATTSGFLALIDPNAARPARQSQWSIGIQREITHNTVIEATYVGNRGVWWPSGTQAYLNQLSPQNASVYGLSPYSNATDNLLLGSAISSSGVTSRLGNLLPYSGYATSNTLLNALRPYPQFSTIGVTNSTTGKTFYDSLQMKGTKRTSHGLQINGTFTWSKAMQLIRPNLFVPSNKSIQTIDQPFVFNANILYTTQSWFAKRMVNQAVKDWSIGAYLEYGSGLPLTPPAATNTNFIGGSEQYRIPGVPLYTKDLNCGCINPYQDVVLNSAAWANPVNGTFGPASGTLYGDFRQARRPQENMNIGRTFHFKENRMSFQIRAEFTNIFNRTQIGNPITTNPASTPSKNGAGQFTGGFGVVNLTVSGPNQAPTYTQNAVVGQLYQLPRSGTLIARFSF